MSNYTDSFLNKLPSFQLASFISPYRITKRLGKGVFGSVYLLCNETESCKRVLKVQRLDNKTNEFLKEVHNQRWLKHTLEAYGYDDSLVPTIYDVQTIKGKKGRTYGLIIMDRVDTTLDQLLKIKQPEKFLYKIYGDVLDIIDIFCNVKFIHGDLHTGNIGYFYTSDTLGNILLKPVILDYGWSSTDAKCRPGFELLQFMRTVEMSADMDVENYAYLIGKSRLYADSLGIPYYGDIRDDKVYSKLHEEYQDQVYYPNLDSFSDGL